MRNEPGVDMVEDGDSGRSQIAISKDLHPRLDPLTNDLEFLHMVDFYKFAVAYALMRGAKPEVTRKSRKTIYSIATLDSDGSLQFAVAEALDIEPSDVLAHIQELAEWGIREIDSKLEASSARVGDLLAELHCIGGKP